MASLPPDAELHSALIAQAPDALIFSDPNGIIRVWNAEAEALFGYPAAEAIGRSLDLIIPEHLRARHWDGYRRAIEAGRTRPDAKPMLTRATHKDGSKLYVEFAFAVVCAGQQVLGAMATARAASRP